MRTLSSLFLLGVLLAAIPARTFAQSTITGVVADASNAVLPGVAVEASSPVLIEKARTVVTDGTGQYRIVDLPAGTYTVTFTLAGFSTVKREGIRLTGSFTASVNAQLSLGALEETVTVTGESPIVDVQGSKVQQTIDDETIAVIPNARQYFSFTASRTFSIVPMAVARAFFEPSSRISRSRSGLASTSARRARIGSR